MMRSDNMMVGTLRKLEHMIVSGDGRHMCYLMAFIVVSFLVVYFMIR